MLRSALAVAVVAGLLAGCARQEERVTQRPGSAAQASVQSAETRICLADLAQTGSTFRLLPDRDFGAGCEQRGVVQLDGVAGDAARIALTNLGPVTCPLADKAIGWARFGVDRAARQILGNGLAQIETFGSYSCRNVAGSSRRSAHSRANAIDVAAFVLTDGRRISVKDDWHEGSSEERRFLRIVHDSACKRFGTVLGPEYNAAHRDHLHLEMSGNAFCR
ncbi:extensin family protein [Altererythrobacter sp. HHU K3-1]|uniref:Extensin family protein n=2 Tax=Qipengyuania atrilutea TaxID=2744473 RepID=A0A850GZZ3_9SPHN|nr:extensin family protein [Actirhodobacter atriluteus]